MGEIVKKNLPCICGSSDAKQQYADGTYYCFSCNKFFPSDDQPPALTPKIRNHITPEEISTYRSRGFKERKVVLDVCKFFGVRVSYDASGEIDTHYYPYGDGSYKIRVLPKDFTWLNKSSGLFGKDKFNSGGASVIICEGEMDTLSVATAILHIKRKITPVVGLSSSVMAEKSCVAELEWLRSFDKIILCFDEDDAGEKARREAAKVLGNDKVYIVKLPLNDANMVLVEMGTQALYEAITGASKWIPSGIITKESLWDQLITYRNTPSVPYPRCVDGLNSKMKGVRLGEITALTSGTSCGKSTLLREILLWLKEVTGEMIGVLSLEESPAESAMKFAGMFLGKNPSEFFLDDEELKRGFDGIFNDDKIMLLDHQGAIDDDSLMDKLEYMALSGCKYFGIDHITMLVSEGSGGLQGNEAIDKVMNDLMKFVKRRNVWVGLISHLRKTPNASKPFEEGHMPTIDDLKGSGSIKQVSNDVIGFSRNLMAEDPVERTSVKTSVLKCRFTGKTGLTTGEFVYIYKTGRLMHIDDADLEAIINEG